MKLKFNVGYCTTFMLPYYLYSPKDLLHHFYAHACESQCHFPDLTILATSQKSTG